MLNFLKKFGYEIKKLNKDFKNPSLDEILKMKVNKNPLIFDVGGNKGQSVIKFKKFLKNLLFTHLNQLNQNLI